MSGDDDAKPEIGGLLGRVLDAFSSQEPPGLPGLVTLDAEPRFAPGEAIDGRVRWQLETPPDAIELRLYWATEGRGTQDVTVERRTRIEASGQEGEAAFSLEAPPGPHSFSGKLVSVGWGIEAVALPAEDRIGERVPLVISPARQPLEIRGRGEFAPPASDD